MKKNRLYIAGFLLAAVNLFSGCSEDDPSYANLVADKQELTINLDEKAEGVIQIIQGNGNYKVTSSNEDVVTATIDNDQIQVTGLKAGDANVTITDW
ncbi:pilus assembly protein N-terminal domain-containing protein [Bacteroides ovatus]|nr:pilus assembly protein N-terminal domain-containing protein [Bacteroides ovatus]MCS2523426.1 pilus assembly protein N-terminal domain-containing protein [Bacteroides ovatus]MCS2681197.1 pilus assembly protein N-terminal domain-containing protein [Bacteroides ovatus]MCS2812652.1 pilus assembly protein N-terminal domain-containing protein [Bacteroides ovatus]MCS3101557.1 pilus assembly protein N-terminal domain-containing protein [Bacteroides ovatus]